MKKKDYEIVFKGIDYWSRPMFQIKGKPNVGYLSDLNNLFPDGTSEAVIIEWYKGVDLLYVITYHGREWDCDPDGTGLRQMANSLTLVPGEEEN